MINKLKLAFNALERFEGEIIVDASGPMTVIVGPNGSGKSTFLEALAEVMIFLHRYPLEGTLAEIRRNFQTQRPTRPNWERATVEVELDALTTLVIGGSMEKSLGGFRGGALVRLTVVKRGTQRLVLESITCDDRSLIFDLTGHTFVDSVRMGEAKAELQQFEQLLKKNIAEAKNNLKAQRQAGADQHLLQVATKRIEDAEAALNSQESTARREQLQKEIEEGENGAVPLSGGGQVLKRDIEAFHGSIGWPDVVYLQGWPDMGPRIKDMTRKLGGLKAMPRSERPGSPYVAMCNRLHTLLRMDVTIDSKDSHVLLVEDRPTEEVSLGTWFALGFAAICEAGDENMLVVWDEPETGLHSTWARKIGDLMQHGKRRRFVIATHRTEFVPMGGSAGLVYKTLARPDAPGQKAICTMREASGLLHGFSIASALGLEPSRVLFTANAVIWVEGPSDVVYWRFWLREAAQARRVDLVEGFDYCFMFSGGTLLANETFGSEALSSDEVDLLRLVGASIVIIDTDFNPDDEKLRRISREQLLTLLNSGKWKPRGFVFEACHQHLKPRVRALLATLACLHKADNLSTVVSTWGREAENGWTDEAFRCTLRRVYDVKDGEPEATVIDQISIEDWRSFQDQIAGAFVKHVGDTRLAKLWSQQGETQIVAQMSIVRDKVGFAQAYVEASRKLGLRSVRDELRGVIDEVFDWILSVKESYGH